MDKISRLGLFLEVVKYQSFAGAARHLGMTGPALSKQVQALEDHLGVRLLNRTTRQVTLTEEGALYSERARKALEDLSEAELYIQDLKAHPKGILRLNAPMSFGSLYLTQPIVAFAKRYPEVQIDADFDDRHVDILGEGYDIVVRIGALEDSSLIARFLAPCPVLLCATPAYLARHGTPQTAEDLLDMPAILYTKQGLHGEWRYKDPTGQKGSLPLKRAFAANNAALMVEACLEGLGLALLPTFSVIEPLQTGQLVALLPDHRTDPERGIYAIFPQNRYLSTKTRLFADWLTAYSKQLPWYEGHGQSESAVFMEKPS